VEALTTFDYVALGVIAASVILGLWRGVIGEILAIAAWVAAFLVARAGAEDVAAMLGGMIAQPAMRLLVAYAAIVVVVLVLFAVGRRLLSLLVRAAGLGLPDRLLGAAFGVLRGLLVVLVLVMLAGLTPVPAQDWWRAAVLAPPLETAVIAAKPWLPQELAKRIKYR
jgi:membrane protein required for colicin V production